MQEPYPIYEESRRGQVYQPITSEEFKELEKKANINGLTKELLIDLDKSCENILNTIKREIESISDNKVREDLESSFNSLLNGIISYFKVVHEISTQKKEREKEGIENYQMWFHYRDKYKRLQHTGITSNIVIICRRLFQIKNEIFPPLSRLFFIRPMIKMVKKKDEDDDEDWNEKEEITRDSAIIEVEYEGQVEQIRIDNNTVNIDNLNGWLSNLYRSFILLHQRPREA
jgi:hypothetical protein